MKTFQMELVVQATSTQRPAPAYTSRNVPRPVHGRAPRTHDVVVQACVVSRPMLPSYSCKKRALSYSDTLDKEG